MIIGTIYFRDEWGGATMWADDADIHGITHGGPQWGGIGPSERVVGTYPTRRDRGRGRAAGGRRQE